MNRLNKLLALLLALMMALSVAGCAQSAPEASPPADTTQSADEAQPEEAPQEEAPAEAPAEETDDTITVVDHLDNQVTLPRNIERIAVCDIYPLPSVLTIFFDSAEKIVGMADPSMIAAKNSLLGELYPDILNAETGYISGSDINTEELMKLNPDVVFYSASNPQQGEQLTNAGFNAVALSVSKWGFNTIETLNQWIDLLSQIFPDNDKADKVRAYSEEAYNLVQERVSGLADDQRRSAFFLFQYDESSIATSGGKFFGQWWADAIGVKNVAGEVEGAGAVTVNMEQIIAWNPDLIFITNFNQAQPADLTGNTVGNYDWSSVDAVVNDQLFKMPLGMYRSYTPGVDTPITLLWLAKAAYPDLFEDIDVTAKCCEYYKDVFGVELTEEQANRIFTPVSAAGNVF